MEIGDAKELKRSQIWLNYDASEQRVMILPFCLGVPAGMEQSAASLGGLWRTDGKFGKKFLYLNVLSSSFFLFLFFIVLCLLLWWKMFYSLLIKESGPKKIVSECLGAKREYAAVRWSQFLLAGESQLCTPLPNLLFSDVFGSLTSAIAGIFPTQKFGNCYKPLLPASHWELVDKHLPVQHWSHVIWQYSIAWIFGTIWTE